MYAATFEFAPPVQSAAAQTGMTIALIAPELPAASPGWEGTAADFATSLQADLEEVLIARGFKVRGPFLTPDAMVYNDKEDSQLMLLLRLDITARNELASVDAKSELNLLGPNREYFIISNGTVTVGGRLTLALSEPLTREKLWTSSTDLPTSSKAFVGELQYDIRPTDPIREPQYRSAVNQALEEIYSPILAECWDRLDPTEMLALRTQVEQIRTKAGYKIGS